MMEPTVFVKANCGHYDNWNEVSQDGLCSNCSAWRAFKRNLIYTAIVLSLFIGSSICVAYAVANWK